VNGEQRKGHREKRGRSLKEGKKTKGERTEARGHPVNLGGFNQPKKRGDPQEGGTKGGGG